MDVLIQLFLLWFSVTIGLAVGYTYLGGSFVIWVAGGIAIFSLIPIPMPDFTDPNQILIWGIIVVLYLLVWYLFVKPQSFEKPKEKLPKDLLVGEFGVAIEAPDKAGGLKIAFPYPIRGYSEWSIIQLDDLKAGDKIIVVDIIGKSLVVNKLQPQDWTSK